MKKFFLYTSLVLLIGAAFGFLGWGFFKGVGLSLIVAGLSWVIEKIDKTKKAEAK